MKLKLDLLFIVAITTVLLGGCASPARIDQMSIRSFSAEKSSDSALHQNIGVQKVEGGQETNPMWVSNVSNKDFAGALETSLRTAGMYSGGSELGEFALVAHLNKLDQPLLGLNMTVTATVNYSLVHRKSGKEILVKTFSTPYTATVSDAFVGVERLRLANEGAVRENITNLITELAALKVSKVSVVTSNAVTPKDVTAQLTDLKSLHDRGLIDSTIYKQRQKEILGK